MPARDASEEALTHATALFAELGIELETDGRGAAEGFAREGFDGAFPAAGVRFAQANAVHIAENDLANVNVFVGKGRDEEEILFFHRAALAENEHFERTLTLASALGLEYGEIVSTPP